eukprot:286191-Rhodomonas_salina.1
MGDDNKGNDDDDDECPRADVWSVRVSGRFTGKVVAFLGVVPTVAAGLVRPFSSSLLHQFAISFSCMCISTSVCVLDPQSSTRLQAVWSNALTTMARPTMTMSMTTMMTVAMMMAHGAVGT